MFIRVIILHFNQERVQWRKKLLYKRYTNERISRIISSFVVFVVYYLKSGSPCCMPGQVCSFAIIILSIMMLNYVLRLFVSYLCVLLYFSVVGNFVGIVCVELFNPLQLVPYVILLIM